MSQHYLDLVKDLLASADIAINGSRPWDIKVHNDKLYSRVMRQGTLGLGEAYMDGWWDCDALDEMVHRAGCAHLDDKIMKNPKIILRMLFTRMNILAPVLLNMQNKKRASKVGEQHYDAGNDLYQIMLDKNMNYTCGYWKGADDLDQAQENKLRLVCEKLKLKPEQRVLDIGCGFGGFAKFAAENYGAHVVGITISKEQLKLGQECCKGLPVELRFQDYRDVDEQFDHIVSLGMFEHVGCKNYSTYMQRAHRCLKDGGLFLLHTIGGNTSTIKTEDWINKYIFPYGMLPSIKQIGKSIEKLFVMEDWHNFGAYYDYTLQAWHSNINQRWDQVKRNYNDRFKRMWDYYLLSCAGSFRARNIQLWQLVLSKFGVAGVYETVR